MQKRPLGAPPLNNVRADATLLGEISSSLSGGVIAGRPGGPLSTAAAPSVRALGSQESAVTGALSAASLEEEREKMVVAHRRRMADLDGIRRLLETRAAEVEAAHKAVERDRRRLHSEYEAKILELQDAKGRLEHQVSRHLA
jgi:hypothetical protein